MNVSPILLLQNKGKFLHFTKNERNLKLISVITFSTDAKELNINLSYKNYANLCPKNQ